MWKGNALPPPARWSICDIDVGHAKPIAQRVRKVAPNSRKSWPTSLRDCRTRILSTLLTRPIKSNCHYREEEWGGNHVVHLLSVGERHDLTYGLPHASD